MKNSLKVTSLAVLTASIISLPPAMAEMQPAQPKCQAKMGMSKCAPKQAGKCSPKSAANGKCGTKSKGMSKCAPKRGAKCAPKCSPKS